MDLTSAVAVNVNAFFFDVTKFFKGQVRIIARAGASAHMKLLRQVLCEIGHFEFRDFFCIHRSTNRNGAFPWISFTIFSLRTFRKNPFYYLLCPVSISRLMKAKKSQNSRGKTRAMESHFYTMIFFFLSWEFSNEHSERFLTILFNTVLVFLEE